MLAFNIPSITQTLEDAQGRFVIEPLERGYGTTLGNALRRVMLSSLPGAAVEYIRIDGVLHEFSTLPGVKEDITEIVMNVKGIVVKMLAEKGSGHLDFVGPGIVTAGDIKCADEIEIVNPSQVIATVAEGARLYIEFGFAAGRGYVSAEKNKLAAGVAPLGTIFVDSIFTPVLGVSYTVENTRVGSMTDLDKLTVDVKTDGSLAPTEAMALASDIIIRHFEFISALAQPVSHAEMVQDSETLALALLETPVDTLELSLRSHNCLRRAGVETVGDLTQLTESEVLQIRNLGKKSFEEICAKMQELGISFKEAEE